MTNEQLRQIATRATLVSINTYAPLLNRYMHNYNICGKLREAAFLATVIHESGSFRYTKEIASGKAYEGRKDLGNIYKGDGVKFRGRGLIQLTGRSNYERASKALGVDFVSNPQLLEQPRYATQVSCWWWADKGLNEIADTGDFRRITRVVNGGYTGLADRNKWYNLALKILG
jgi:putative chitinase